MCALRRAAAVTAAALAFVGPLGAVAADAASGADVPAVDIVPVGTTHNDPNQGNWFVSRMLPGTTAHAQARLINPATVAQSVTVYARALDFDKAGTPSLATDATAGIGGWVTFDEPSVTVPPLQAVDVGYTVTVPADAEPGDHTGALVAQSEPSDIGGRLQLVKRIATRFYVTVPGKAVVSYRLENLQTHVDNPLFPGDERTSVSVENTGTIRFVPDVRINGRGTTGSTLVLTRSVEVYRSTVHVPWYGGPVHVRVTATADGHEPKTLTTTVWVVPWGLLAIVVVALVAATYLGVLGRRRWRAFKAEQESLRAQLAALQSGSR